MRGSAQGKRHGKCRPAPRRRVLGKTFLSLARQSLDRAHRLDIATVAGSLAFTSVLSIAPLLAVVFSFFKFFGGLSYAYEKLMPFLLDNLSEGTGEVVEEHLSAFVQNAHVKALGWAGVAALFVTSILAYSSILKAFNQIWETHGPLRAHHRLLRAVLLLAVAPILLIASVALSTAVAAHLDWVPHGGRLVAFALTFALYTMVYGLVPMARVPARAVFVGSLLPAVLWESAKYGYALYTKKVVTYSAFYGSFAAFPLFLLWIYIAWYITLFGGVWVRTLQLHFEAKPS